MVSSVPRTGLVDEAVSHSERRLVLIEAPSGSGKSTLLRQIAARLSDGGQRVRLINLTHDADAVALGQALLAALAPGGRDGNRPGAETLDQLILQMEQAASALQAPVCILMDDFQRVISPDALTLVTRLLYLDPAPPLRLMIASRVAAGLAVTALRLQGQVLELGAHELRLNDTEAIQMLRASGISVPQELWLRFVRRVGGWAVALRLALILLRDQRIALDELPDFSGRQREMAAYLSQLVVEGVPSADRGLLFKAAAFDQLRPDVMAAAIGGPETGRLLRLLAALALPLEGGDNVATPRLHGLVGEFLEAEARGAGVDLGAIRRRAADYLAAQGEWRKAISVALRSGDMANAAGMAERGGGWRLIYRGEDGAAQQFSELARLAPTELAATPRTILGLAISAAKRGEIDLALNRIEQAREVIAPDRVDLQAELRLIAALLDLYCDRRAAADLVAQLEADITPMTGVDPVRLALTRNLLCFFSLQSSQFDAAIRFGRLAIRDFRAAGSDFGAAHLPIHVGQAEFLSGQFESAKETLAEHAERCRRELGSDADLTLMTRVIQYEIEIEAGRTGGSAEDVEFLEHAFDRLGHRDSWYDPLASALISRTRLALLAGNDPDHVLQHARAIAVRRHYSRLADLVELLRIEALLRLGQSADAARLLASAQPALESGPTPGGDPVSMRGPLRTTLQARLALAEGRHDEALRILADSTLRARGNVPRLTRLAALRLRILLAAGQADTAWAELVDLAVRQRLDDLCLPFAEEGTALHDHITGRFAMLAPASLLRQRLQPVFELVRRHRHGESAPGEVLLTPSEALIIARLEHGLSNKEIARALGISGNTVKFHLANIYRKLDAGNRTTALARARDLGLLAPPYRGGARPG
ncbi:MAG: AAA family ATPase [Rubellimicrobium sp.]|nr:AAA family ATPase [Rubellimicrobium sp.]